MQRSHSTRNTDDQLIANKYEIATVRNLCEQEVQGTMKLIYRDQEKFLEGLLEGCVSIGKHKVVKKPRRQRKEHMQRHFHRNTANMKD